MASASSAHTMQIRDQLRPEINKVPVVGEHDAARSPQSPVSNRPLPQRVVVRGFEDVIGQKRKPLRSGCEVAWPAIRRANKVGGVPVKHRVGSENGISSLNATRRSPAPAGLGSQPRPISAVQSREGCSAVSSNGPGDLPQALSAPEARGMRSGPQRHARCSRNSPAAVTLAALDRRPLGAERGI